MLGLFFQQNNKKKYDGASRTVEEHEKIYNGYDEVS